MLESAHNLQILVINNAVAPKMEDPLKYIAEDYLVKLADGCLKGEILNHDSIAISKYLRRTDL